MRLKYKEQYKDFKLSKKIALSISVMLIVTFIVIIGTAVLGSQISIKKSVDGELKAIAKAESVEARSLISTATSTGRAVADYMIGYVDRITKDPSLNTSYTELSSLFRDLKLSDEAEETENYLVNFSKNTLVNNKNITGIGFFFEPYIFTGNHQIYSFYMDNSGEEVKTDLYNKYEEYSDKVYYKKAKEAGNMVFTEPYIDSVSGIQVVTIAVPIMVNNTFKGEVIVDFTLSNFDNVQVKSGAFKSLYSNIIMNDGTIAYSSNKKEFVGKNILETYKNKSISEDIKQKMSQNKSFKITTTNSDGNRVSCYYEAFKSGEKTWYSISSVKTSEVNKTAFLTALIMIVISIVALTLIILLMLKKVKNMLKPMDLIVNVAKDISNGNLEVNLQKQTNDEIGILIEEFNKMTKYLKLMINDVGNLLDEMASGNFNVKTEIEYIGDFNPILASINEINTKLSHTMGRINEAANQVASGSEQVSFAAQDLSQGAVSEASVVEDLSEAITKVSENVKLNADSAIKASARAGYVSEEIMNSNDKMKKMTEAIKNITISSNEISNIIETINEIAEQTNLLALNAAIEAARAGESGKGFAVVADEVRKLAEKSSEATKDTAILIEKSINSVNNGTIIAQETAESLMNLIKDVKEVSDMADNIAKASEEQKKSINQVTTAVDEVSGVVQTTSATAEESAASSEELSAQAQTLKELIGTFKLKE